MKKLNLAVIFGGASPEHDISLLSACNLIHDLNKEKYNIYKLGITKNGKWLMYEGDAASIADGSWEDGDTTPAFISPDASHGGIIAEKEGAFQVIKIDVIYVIIHGETGEDGTIQGLAGLAGIPCAGADRLSSAVCMDKDFAKTILKHHNISQLDWLALKGGVTEDNIQKIEN